MATILQVLKTGWMTVAALPTKAVVSCDHGHALERLIVPDRRRNRWRNNVHCSGQRCRDHADAL